jgi:uncharacterized protein (DUF1015 family)
MKDNYEYQDIQNIKKTIWFVRDVANKWEEIATELANVPELIYVQVKTLRFTKVCLL